MSTFFRIARLVAVLGLPLCPASGQALDLAKGDMENIVRRSYQYVALFNVNNKFAIDPSNPMSLGGWNRVAAQEGLLDHTMKAIARPNNDTFYTTAMLDLRTEPMVLEAPAIDSTYVSLMVTAYDHYVNIPMSTRLGDFRKPSRMLLYSARTPGYGGEPVEGVDLVFEATGDFVSAIYRVVPHANEPERMARIVEQTKAIRVIPLSEYLGREAPPAAPQEVVPEVGKTDYDIFGDRLLEVMQYVFNHTTFDPYDGLDQGVLAAYAPLGVVPGQPYDPAKVAAIDGAALRKVAEVLAPAELAKATDPKFRDEFALGLFKPKGEMSLDRLVFQSILGPIGLPAAEAVYPAIGTEDGQPMNALHDYEIRMLPDEMPPAEAFWSVTLYDVENGFFIPNDRKKYSVGLNGGMKLDADGGITIRISAEPSSDVPKQNWLPISRMDQAIGAVMRLYVPDLEQFKTWKAPIARRLP